MLHLLFFDQLLNNGELGSLSEGIDKWLKSGQIYMKDAEFAESKEKSIFWFLFFELW